MQSILGTAAGLGNIADEGEEYHLLTYANASDWVRPVARGAVKLAPISESGLSQLARRTARTSPGLGRAVRGVRRKVSRSTSWSPAPTPDVVAAVRPDVVHLIRQEGFTTDLPTLYHPHDLQHLHLPDLFTPTESRRRDEMYRHFCRRAVTVFALTTWGKEDLINHYELPEDRIAVVPWASVLDTYPSPSPEDIDSCRRRHRLGEDFLLYPAQMWAHKNHENLLRALKLLGTHGLRPQLVLTGSPTPHTRDVIREVARLGLREQVRILGFVSTSDVAALYHACRAVVFPSRFEGWGMPVLEAMSAGKPVVCSNVTSLPSLLGEAGLLFDPLRPDEMAARMEQVLSDDDLVGALAERGRVRATLFSWDHTARLLRSNYRRVAGKPTDDDLARLSERPLV